MSTPADNSTDTQNLNGSESHQATVDYKKRYKDTQSAYTKSQQLLKATEAKLNVLQELVKPQINLDQATQKELDDLMYSDPHAWRNKMNELENKAKAEYSNTLSEAEKAASLQVELERRASLLDEYNRNHPNAPITDEVIKFDVPPRITSKLEKGEISFDDYLTQVHEFLYTPKKIGSGQEVLRQPNLSNLGGGPEASEGAASKDYVANYKNLTLL